MRYALIAAALVGAVAASPAWAPPAYGGNDDGSWGSASTVDQTTVVTVTSCPAEVTNCPADQPTGYPVTTPVESYPAESTPYSPETTSEGVYAPSSYGSPSAPASAPASTPYSPEQPPASLPVESIPPPAATYPAGTAPPAGETPYSPVGGSAPPAYPSGAPSGVPVYPIPGNGTYGGSPTASGAPSGSQAYPIQQTGNTAAGVKAGSFLAGAGALAALLL